MADIDNESKAEASAEKAYAAAAESMPAAVEKAEAPEGEADPVAPAVSAKPEPAKATKSATAKRSPAKKSLATAKRVKPVKKTPASSKTVKVSKPAPKVAKQTGKVAAKTDTTPKSTPISSVKEETMATKAKIAEGIQEVVSEAQAKAKLAVEKGSSFVGECTEFTKGNVEAVITSGKILATGLQGLGKEFVAEGRTAFDTVTSEVKELAAVKSPTEFVKVQSEIARKNLDTAFELGSKNTEAVFKLASDVMAPISGRFSLAAEKVRKAAA